MPTDPSTRRRALEWAERSRTARQHLRTQLSRGESSLRGVLEPEQPDPLVEAVTVLYALESLPGARKIETRRALDRDGIDPSTRLADLTEAERARLLARFDVDGSAA